MLEAAGRDVPHETGGLKGKNGFSNSYTTFPGSVVCPCSALCGETWGRPGGPVPLFPAAGCTLMRQPWTDIGATALGRAPGLSQLQSPPETTNIIRAGERGMVLLFLVVSR